MHKKTIFLIIVCIFCFLAIPVAAYDLSLLSPEPWVASQWSWRDSTGSSGEIPGSYPVILVREREKAVSAFPVSLETRFRRPAGTTGGLGLVFFKNSMAFQVYVNDVLIDTVGRMPPGYFFQPYLSRGVLIHESLLREENTLRLEAWNDDGLYKIRHLSLMDESSWRRAMAVYQFLDVQLPRFASILLGFVALYSLFLFVNYREKTESLCLSLGSLLFALYLLNVTIADSPVPYLQMKAFLYCCFPLSMIFIFRFFRTFFRMRTGTLAIRVITGIGVAFALGYWVQPTTGALDSWHSLMLLYPVAAVVYGCVGAVRCLRSGSRDTLPTLAGLTVAVLFSAYDIYYFIGDLTPFILLQGIGFMSLILGTFYSFSLQIARTNRQCALFSQDLQVNKQHRDALFERIRQDSIKSESASSLLNSSIERVGALVSQYLASTERINADLEIQNRQVEANSGNVATIFAALQETSGMVEQHGLLVEKAVSNIQDLTAGIHQTDRLVRVSGDTIRTLTGTCLAADRDVADSGRFVDELASYSRNINEIVSAIGDLAEQTNILSINAAIEAARSGQMGKGFAVVAQEIRSLATRSGESASKIREILGTMVEMIRNIQNQETRVSARLKEIVQENNRIEASITEIVGVLKQQLERNSEISAVMNNLVDTVGRISAQAQSQRLSGEELRTSLEVLENATQSLVSASADQRSCNSELTGSLDQLRRVSEENLDVVTDLKHLIE